METNKLVRLVGLNIGIAILDIVLFSEGLLHIQIGAGNAFETAFGVTAMLMSVLIFVSGNYKILTKKQERLQEREINTPEECVLALRQHHDKKTFTRDIATMIEQTQRFNRKKETIQDILLQKFSIGEMSYSKFHGTVVAVEEVFYRNVKSILNKFSAFDEVDYVRIRVQKSRNQFSDEFIQSKMEIYNQYILFVKDAIEDNEQILLKLDKLLLELSKFNSLEDGEIENMTAMVEIDELISKTKFYK